VTGNRFGVTRAVLDEPDDGELAWKAIQPVWDSFDPDAHPAEVERQLNELTLGQKALYAVDWCYKEVFNGGFAQYFANSAGNLAYEALEGFQLIGADRYGAALQGAMGAFPNGKPPRDRAERLLVLARLTENSSTKLFEDNDAEFFRLIKGDDVERYRARYVRSHPEEFSAP
jgi:hypothetical protein